MNAGLTPQGNPRTPKLRVVDTESSVFHAGGSGDATRNPSLT